MSEAWAGSCCGGPDGVDGPDDKLWERIQRTPALAGKAKNEVSALCMARGEASCTQGCMTSSIASIPEQFQFCQKGQVCVWQGLA